MAEIISGESHKKRKAGVAKTKKLSTRIDLTAMVDLGFLLITFFIFTTTMSQPTSMKLVMPDEDAEMPVKQSGALTLLPAINGRVYYYEGKLVNTHLKITSLKGVRAIIMDKRRRTPEMDFFVIIEPANASVYGDIVNVLDEMTINGVKRYAIANITKQEEARMN